MAFSTWFNYASVIKGFYGARKKNEPVYKILLANLESACLFLAYYEICSPRCC